MTTGERRSAWASALGLMGPKFRQASLGAVALSVALHALFLLVSALVLVGHAGTGGGQGGETAPVEMAVVTETELTKLEEASLGAATPSVPDTPLRDTEVTTQIADAGMGSESTAAGEGLGDVGPMAGAGDISRGTGEGLGGSGGGGANFFGVEASGNRFVYLVDVSQSMVGDMGAERAGTRMDALRAELTRSVDALMETSHFGIVKFSSEAELLGEGKNWTEASEAGKKKFRTIISLLQPEGGTNPLPGFQIIFSMRPRPDAIYFMTDGEFDKSVVEEVELMNKKFRVPIHCICLGSQQGGENMKRLAKGSHGTFTYVGGP